MTDCPCRWLRRDLAADIAYVCDRASSGTVRIVCEHCGETAGGQYVEGAPVTRVTWAKRGAWFGSFAVEGAL